MKFYVYILLCSDGKYYVGCTVNLKERFKRHSLGKSTYTSKRLPLIIVNYTVFNNKYHAFKYEKYLKSGSGRAFMNKRLLGIKTD